MKIWMAFLLGSFLLGALSVRFPVMGRRWVLLVGCLGAAVLLSSYRWA
jgi:hypothetical protein